MPPVGRLSMPGAIPTLGRCHRNRRPIQYQAHSVPIFSFSLVSLDLRPKFTAGAEILFPPERNCFVERSLSVLLPVKDAQATLTASVHEILDVVADSSDRFEVLIIDDASTDATSEVAHELTHHYPQVRVVRHERSLGPEAAIRTGLQRSEGELVVMRECRGFRILERRQPAKQAPSRPARPNYLDRLRRFVLSE
jgi:hypothetical protein